VANYVSLSTLGIGFSWPFCACLGVNAHTQFEALKSAFQLFCAWLLNQNIESELSRRLTTLWNSIENCFLERYFVKNRSLKLKMQRKMYGPELVFEIFNFKWKHILTFLSGNMAKNAVCKKLITQKLMKLPT